MNSTENSLREISISLAEVVDELRILNSHLKSGYTNLNITEVLENVNNNLSK
jgi:hypothetical protein